MYKACHCALDSPEAQVRNSFPMNVKHSRLPCFVFSLCLLTATSLLRAASGVIDKGGIQFAYNDRGISGLTSKDDPFNAAVTPPNQPLGLTIRYQVGDGAWELNVNTGQSQQEASPESGVLKYTLADAASPLKVVQTFNTDGKTLDWTIDVENTTNAPVTIGDFAIDIPVVGPRGENPKQIFEHGFIKHQFIRGQRLVHLFRARLGRGAVPHRHRPAGHEAGIFRRRRRTRRRRRRVCAFRRERPATKSAAPGGSRTHLAETRRAPAQRTARSNTASVSNGRSPTTKCATCFTRKGLFDIRAVPGMTIPTDLTAKFALHTKAHIESSTAEFPAPDQNHRASANRSRVITSTKSPSRSSAKTC